MIRRSRGQLRSASSPAIRTFSRGIGRPASRRSSMALTSAPLRARSSGRPEYRARVRASLRVPRLPWCRPRSSPISGRLVRSSRIASRTALASARSPHHRARSSRVRGAVVIGTPRRSVHSPSSVELRYARTPPCHRGPPLPGRVTVSKRRGSDQNPSAAAALAMLRTLPGAVKVAPIHLPHSSSSRRGATAYTPSSATTSRPTPRRYSTARSLSPSSISCRRDTRLNWRPAISAMRTSHTPP